ncbi:MAG: GNAT family N-acetyltransferase [Geminicoccaceae bacterium]
MIEPREITYWNVDLLLGLRVRDDQTDLVASNSVTIAQAHYIPNSWIRGLWAGGDAVGLIAMIDIHPDHPEADEYTPGNTAYLWRLMIAAPHQGRGYGQQSVELALEQARRWRRPRLSLTVAQGDGNALAFYRRFGLEPTGQVDDDEIVLIGPVPMA